MVYGKLWVSALPEILGCDHSKETSLAVHTFLIFKKNYNKRFGNVIEVWLWTFGDERI